MKINRKLLIIAVSMLPIVVISFVYKNNEANFNLEKNSDEWVEQPDNEESNEEHHGDLSREELSIKVLVDDEVVNLALEDYIVGVVAGEMPASFDIEALKAQAVASRSYALYKKSVSKILEYDLTDNTNTQVYLSIPLMKKKWGSDFLKYYDKIKEAVLSTKDEVMTYDGEVIESFYFAMSAGSTEDSASVFSETRDYLQSVYSEYDNDSLRDFERNVTFKLDDFRNKLALECDAVVIDDIDKNESGYVNKISICSKSFKGTDFRKLLGLRSTNFTIDIGEEVSIVTRGYGHGVGMSQYGANGYANHGYTYQDILKHYYTGVEITKLEV